jgi:hypothetical protein
MGVVSTIGRVIVRLNEIVTSRMFWGLLGASAAALFATWLLFFPDGFGPLGAQKDHFAWDVHPRAAQVFIGAGYIFRTAFFLNAAFERSWLKVRWIVWGNLAFTGTLLAATYWHLDQFHWDVHQTWFGHIWIVLYIFEPVTMLYLLPRGILRAPAISTGGPIHPVFRSFLVLVTGLLLMHGLLLLANPDFLVQRERWPWELNPLDARIVAAWFLGWSVWTGTIAWAADWDEVERAAQLFILCGVALFVAGILSLDAYYQDRGTLKGYFGGLAVMSGGMFIGLLWQRVHRPAAS